MIGGTSGLGRAIAIGLAEAGADVVPSGRREALAREGSAEIARLARRSLAVAAGVRSMESVSQLHERVLEAFGGADILVYAAGVMARKPTLEVSKDE